MKTIPRKEIRNEQGMALLLTLGFLCVLMAISLTMAIMSGASKKSSEQNAAAVRTNMLTESAMSHALAEMSVNFENNVFPGDHFAVSGDSWNNRRVLASHSSDQDRGDLKIGLETALATKIDGKQFTGESLPSSSASWIPVLTEKRRLGSDVEALIGRYAYAIIDDTGKIDPGAVVTRQGSEEVGTIRLGYAISDLALGDLGFSGPNRFGYEDGEIPGLMSTNGRWFSMSHLIQALDMTQGEVDLANRTLLPFSEDIERFWRDRNNNGQWDPGEDADRLNLVVDSDLSNLYQLFVGGIQDFNSEGVADDDCAWLKSLDNSPWFQQWRDRVFANYSGTERTARARAAVAAQVAANMADYSDEDSEPTSAYIGSDGGVHVGQASGTLVFQGIEKNWGVSEVAMRIQTDVIDLANPNGDGSVVDGTSSVNDVAFDIVNGMVVPRVSYQATVTVLGVQLGMYNTSYTPPQLIYWCGVTADVAVGNNYLEPWGDYDNCYDNNINDENNPRNFDVPETYPAGTPIAVRGKFWVHPQTYYYYYGTYYASGYDYSRWTLYTGLTSNLDSSRVKVLRDGDVVPEIETSVDDQNNAAYYLQDYIEGNTISLQPNQAIFLFETNTSSYNQDFQDLVTLVTLKAASTIEESNSQIVTHFTVGGRVNINPNNSDQDKNEFFLNKPDGSQLTRDDLHRYGEDYTGGATWIHVKPKATGNAITLNGITYALRTNVTYDFIGNFQTHVYNDRYVNGKAMGQWWIGLEGEATTVLEDGQAYVIEPDEEEATELPVPPEDPVLGNEGNALRLRAGFQVELFYPFGEGAQEEFPLESVDVQYTIQVGTATGQGFTYTGTKNLVPDAAANFDGGTISWTTDFDNDDWITIENAFALDQDPPLTAYFINQARIDSIVVNDRLGTVVDRVPSNSGFFASWASASPSYADATFYCTAEASDPLMNDRGQEAADFDLFWTLTPNDDSLGTEQTTGGSAIGVISGGYQSSPYSGIDAKNATIERLGEIGRIHSFRPKQSLRLWAASSGDESGHDAELLDLFKIGTATQTRGRINANTLNREVLVALFNEAGTIDAESAADAILSKRSSGTTFRNLGQFFAVAGISGTNTSQDKLEEKVAVSLAERLSIRQNYFRLILCAQSVKDVSGKRYRNAAGVETTAALGKFDIEYDSNGKFLGYVDEISSERKVMALIHRDAFSGKMNVQRIETMFE